MARHFLSLLCWNPGLNHGMPNAISRLLLGPRHTVALQANEASSRFTFDGLAAQFHTSQHEDCALLFNQHTFSSAEAQGNFVGQMHGHTWSLAFPS